MRKFFFCVMIVVGFFFVSCSGDGGSAVKPSEGGAVGIMTDFRDSQTYKTVTIGSQTWMAQNINYRTKTAISYCYNDNDFFCAKYGRLYIWDAAMEACPSGWHLPTSAEFIALFDYVGGVSSASNMLKATSGWSNYDGKGGNGLDVYSFSALPAGDWDYRGYFNYEGYCTNFWSSTDNNSSYDAYSMELVYNGSAGVGSSNKGYGFSVRCIKD